ncbi:adenylosuccinate lyase, partial [bacterium]
STMPHKVNPIDFENSEGNLGLANSLFTFMSNKLTKSRLQRDLSDSTVLRNIGVALGYSLIAYKSCLKGLNKISVNEAETKKDLEENIEIITEGVQTVLRSAGISNPYEKMKELSRGNKLSYKELFVYLESLELPEDTINNLRNLSPENYIGLAVEICDDVLAKLKI